MRVGCASAHHAAVATHDGALKRTLHEAVEWQERVLKDRSTWQVYKRFFTAAVLAEELGGGETLYESRWFVAVRC